MGYEYESDDGVSFRICVFHMTHIENLPSIFKEGGLLSSNEMIRQELKFADVGSGVITDRRNKNLLKCHYPAKVRVNDCVPFYFRARSKMLSNLHFKKAKRKNYDSRYGQDNLVFLCYDLKEIIVWSEKNRNLWAFTDKNAGNKQNNFYSYSNDNHFDKLDWDRILNWGDRSESTQAEFLVEDFVSNECVEEIVVRNRTAQNKVRKYLSGSDDAPAVTIDTSFYFE